jgi:uridine kinase
LTGGAAGANFASGAAAFALVRDRDPTPPPPRRARAKFPLGNGSMKPLLVGIAGGTGSGKSTVARRVSEEVHGASAIAIDMDAYYRNLTDLTLEQRRKVNWDHPDAFDFDLLLTHLDALAARQAIDKPVYDFVAHLRSEKHVRVEPADVVVLDGILLFVDPRVRARCDVTAYVDTDADIRLVRRIRRDMRTRGRPLDEILDQYLTTVRPMHQEFVEPTKQFADVIIPRGGHNDMGIEMLVARIHERLKGVAP